MDPNAPQEPSTSIAQLREMARQQTAAPPPAAPAYQPNSAQTPQPPVQTPQPPAPAPVQTQPPPPPPPPLAHPVYQPPPIPVAAHPAPPPVAVADNPLDVFGTEVLSGPCLQSHAGGSCLFGSTQNMKIGVLVAVLSLVVGAVPIDAILGKYLPINRVPMGGGLIKASVLGGISALFVGFLCGHKKT